MSKLTKPCATSWLSATSSPTTRVVDGYNFAQNSIGIQAAIDSITDSSATKPYTVLLYPGIYDCNRYEGPNHTYKIGIDMTGTTAGHEAVPTGAGSVSPGGGGRDYIRLVGLDRESVILQRTVAAGTLTGVIQANENCFLQNFTIDCSVTRSVHWDTGSSSVSFRSDNVRYKGTNAGISTGAGVSATSTSDTIMVLTNNIVDGQLAIHGGPGTNGTYNIKIHIVGNVFNATGTVVGLDFGTNGAQLYSIMMAGNSQPYYNVDHGAGGIDLELPTTLANQAYIVIHSDGSLRFASSNLDAIANNTYYHNVAVYPQNFYGYQVTGASGTGISGDVLIYDFATQLLRSGTATGQNFPAICVNQSDNTGGAAWFPRLATGPRAACFMATAGAVALGDQIVAAAAGNKGYVNNDTGIDTRKILGWAESTKSAVASGLCTVRRNTMWGW